MKAVIWTKYGPPEVLQLKEVEKPSPKDIEILIKVYATTAAAAECTMREGKPYFGRIILGLFKPKYKIPGLELAGEVESAGKKVKRFKKGDMVCGFTGFKLGAYAEYACMPEKASFITKPSNINFDEAASVIDGASTALFFLRDKANIQRGQKVLIIGASGSIGSAAIQLSKYFGTEVTGVCSSANIELVKSLGADEVIDYTKEDFLKNNKTYDIIFDTVNKSSFSKCKKSLNQKGMYLPTKLGLLALFQTFWTKIVGKKRVIFGMSVEKNEGLIFIKKLIESGALKPVIDRIYPLEQIAEAHCYVEKGHKKGNVVITINQPPINKEEK
jgi:NADPH:quinone reductase-like Zn-dependent oxidoreductase